MRLLVLIGMIATLGACVSAPAPGPGPARPIERPDQRPQVPVSGDLVLGQTARILVARFGRPSLDVREGTARKLQFLGDRCVLDAYLYPQRNGGEAVATHVDARLPDGRETDRQACAASLVRD